MELIDFHTHVFPEKIAAGTIEVLRKNMERQSGKTGIAYADGTFAGLVNSMAEHHVTQSVVLPIVTNPAHAASINRYAESLNRNKRESGILSFGGVHPMQPDWEEVLEDLAARGFRGIKLHPEYQQFYIDAPESVRLIRKARELHLLVSVHAGCDIGIAPPVHCTPDRLLHLCGMTECDNVIAAHLGGWKLWDEVEEKIAGTPLYMDTAFLKGWIDPAQYLRIVRKHGADKILFGSDSPWENPEDSLHFLESIGLNGKELAMITHENAERLLG